MNYIIFDLEATCWENDRKRQNEIIEIGAVKLNERLKIVSDFQIFVKPALSPQLSDFCKQLTSISQADVDAAMYFPQAIRQFQEWIGNEPHVLCSWGFYDKNQLQKDCALHQIASEWTDNHISLKHQHGRMIGRERGVGIERALTMLKLPLEGTHHRGIDDAKNIAKIFVKIFDQLKF